MQPRNFLIFFLNDKLYKPYFYSDLYNLPYVVVRHPVHLPPDDIQSNPALIMHMFTWEAAVAPVESTACVCRHTLAHTCYEVACSFIPTVACTHIHWLTRRSERGEGGGGGGWMQQFWKNVWLGSNSCHGFKMLPWKHKLPIKWIWMQSLQRERRWREENGKVRGKESALPDCVPQ